MMLKNKFAVVAVAALMAAAAPLSASAEQLTFTSDGYKSDGLSGYHFEWQSSFQVGAVSNLFGSVTTVGNPATQPALIDLTSVYLLGADGTRINFTPLIDFSVTDDAFGSQNELWTLSFAGVKAGSWFLHVIGDAYADKKYETVTASLDLERSAVPEPGTLALLGAMGVAFAAARRRSSANRG